MTIANQKPLHGFRFVEVQYGDTLQSIAAREMGDAARWSELVAYNNLVPPFVSGDAAAPAGVLRYGALIRLPAAAPVLDSTTDPDRVFERDVRLERGIVAVASGDFAITEGRDNLRQALEHRVATSRGELPFRPQYGSNVRRLIGVVNGPTAALLAAEYAKSAVAADPRISRVNTATAEASGDVIRVSVEAQPIVGRVVAVDVEL